MRGGGFATFPVSHSFDFLFLCEGMFAQRTLKDTLVQHAGKIVSRLHSSADVGEEIVLSQRYSGSSASKQIAAALRRLWEESASEVQNLLQELIGEFPLESQEDEAWLMELLSQGGISAQVDGGASDTTALWLAASVRQRLADLHIQLSTTKTMLRVARAKIKRRNLVLTYVQETLQKEVLYFHEQFLLAVEQKDRLHELDVGVFSFIDFLELVEDSGAVDSSDDDENLDFDQRVRGASSEDQKVKRLRRDKQRARDHDSKLNLVAELSQRWKAESTARVESESREATFRDALGVLRDKCSSFEKTMSTMSTRYGEELQKLRASKLATEKKLHSTNNDLSFAIKKLEEMNEKVDKSNETINDLNEKIAELESLVALLRLDADSEAAQNRGAMSDQAGKLQLERQRIQKVIERLAERGIEVPPDLISGGVQDEEDDDPMLAEVLKNAQSMSELKDQLKAALHEVQPLRDEINNLREKKEEMEKGVETAIKYFIQLGLGLPAELRPFATPEMLASLSQKETEGESGGDGGIASMRLSIERAKALTKVEDLLDTLKQSGDRIVAFRSRVVGMLTKRDNEDIRKLRSPATPSLSDAKDDPFNPGARRPSQVTELTLDAKAAPENSQDLDERVVVCVNEFEAALDTLDIIEGNLQERNDRDWSDLNRLREEAKQPSTPLTGHSLLSPPGNSITPSENNLSTSKNFITVTAPSCSVAVQVDLGRASLSSPTAGTGDDSAPSSPAKPRTRTSMVAAEAAFKEGSMLSRSDSMADSTTTSRPAVRHWWCQTVEVETDSVRTQTELTESVTDTLRAVQEYMSALENGPARAPPTTMKCDVVAPTTEWLVCSECGASLKPQSLASVQFNSVACDATTRVQMLDKECEANTAPVVVEVPVVKEKKHVPTLTKQCQTDATTSAARKDAAVLEKPEVKSMANQTTLSGDVAKLSAGASLHLSGPFPSSLSQQSSGTPGVIEEVSFTTSTLREPMRSGVPSRDTSSSGYSQQASQPFSSMELIPKPEVEDFAVQVNLDPAFERQQSTEALPSVKKQRHISSGQRRRVFSAGASSAKSSTSALDEDDISWSTEQPSRPASGFATAQRNVTSRNIGGRRGDGDMVLDISKKQQHPVRHRGKIGPLSRTQSPPVPMFHHHFPASNQPTIRCMTPQDEERVRREFQQDFGMPLVAYKQLRTRRRQLLLLPPSASPSESEQTLPIQGSPSETTLLSISDTKEGVPPRPKG